MLRKLIPCLWAAVLLAGCINKDYDLREIDLRFTLLGDSIVTPTNSTGELTVAQLMDIEGESSLLTATAAGEYGLEEGDYYLLVEGEEANEFDIDIESVVMDGYHVVYDIEDLSFSAPALFVGSYSHTTEVNKQSSYTLEAMAVTPYVRSVRSAVVDAAVVVEFKVTGEGTTVTIPAGFEIDMPKCLAIEKTAGAELYNSFQLETGKLVTTAEITLPAQLMLHATGIEVEGGDGVSFTPGDLETKESGTLVCTGFLDYVGQATTTVTSERMGQEISSELQVELDIADFDLVSIEGRVAPEFEVSIDALDFVDLPGLLQDESTVMDFRNPQIYLRVENQTALRVQFDNITMRALKDGQDEPLAEVSFGQGQATTEGDAIIGSGQPYRLCISSLGAATEVDSDVKVPTLSQLLRTVPDRIEVVDIECSVVDEDVCVELGRTFGFSITYDVVCPLTFGPELQLCYRDSLKDIHANLPEQIVDVKHMQLTTTVENTVPLDLSIEFVPFDTLGLPIQNVTATVSTYARAGSQAQPTSTELTVDIVSTEGYIDNLDGLELIIYARPEEGNTVTINEAQRIKFLDAVLRIIGGVTVDLN